MRMRLVTISLSSVLYYTKKRNTNILLRSPGMILFRHKALKRYKKKHKHAKTLLFEYSEWDTMDIYGHIVRKQVWFHYFSTGFLKRQETGSM